MVKRFYIRLEALTDKSPEKAVRNFDFSLSKFTRLVGSRGETLIRPAGTPVFLIPVSRPGSMVQLRDNLTHWLSERTPRFQRADQGLGS